jgi:hypothetical protein
MCSAHRLQRVCRCQTTPNETVPCVYGRGLSLLPSPNHEHRPARSRRKLLFRCNRQKAFHPTLSSNVCVCSAGKMALQNVWCPVLEQLLLFSRRPTNRQLYKCGIFLAAFQKARHENMPRSNSKKHVHAGSTDSHKVVPAMLRCGVENIHRPRRHTRIYPAIHTTIRIMNNRAHLHIMK